MCLQPTDLSPEAVRRIHLHALETALRLSNLAYYFREQQRLRDEAAAMHADVGFEAWCRTQEPMSPDEVETARRMYAAW